MQNCKLLLLIFSSFVSVLCSFVSGISDTQDNSFTYCVQGEWCIIVLLQLISCFLLCEFAEEISNRYTSNNVHKIIVVSHLKQPT